MGAGDLSGHQRTGDECSRPRAPHPSILEAAGLVSMPRARMRKRQRIRKRNDWGECGGLKQADGHDHPERRDREIQQRRTRREDSENRKLGTKSMEKVGEASGKWTAHEPHRGAGAQHQPERFRRQAASGQEWRQERRKRAERTEERGIEEHEWEKRAALNVHGHPGSRAR